MKWIKNKLKIDKKGWHLWFAWKPVVVLRHPDGNEEKAWGETLLRRFVFDTSGVKHGIGGFWKAEYKYRPNKIHVHKVKVLTEGDTLGSMCPKTRGSVPNKPTAPPPAPRKEPKVDLFDNHKFRATISEEKEECKHENGTIEKMGGTICSDCGVVIEVQSDRITIPAKEVATEPNLHKPEAMKEAFRVTMTPDKPKQHEIDISWEVKNARRNKTIM